jgi:hypothetical protein
MATAALAAASIQNLADGGNFMFGSLPDRKNYNSQMAFENANAFYFQNLLEQACSLTNRPL